MTLALSLPTGPDRWSLDRVSDWLGGGEVELRFDGDALDHRKLPGNLPLDQINGSRHCSGTGVLCELQIHGQQHFVATDD